MSAGKVISIGTLVLVITLLIFFLSVDWSLYSACFSYDCFTFFSKEFSLLLTVISAEIAFFSFLAALAKLSLSHKSLERTKYFQDYSLFKEILEFEKKEETLEGLDINTPLLFRSILYADEKSSDFDALRNFLKKDTGDSTLDTGTLLKRHMTQFSALVSKIGVNVPETDPTVRPEIEASCINFLNRLLDTFFAVSTVDSSRKQLKLPIPDILPPEAQRD